MAPLLRHASLSKRWQPEQAKETRAKPAAVVGRGASQLDQGKKQSCGGVVGGVMVLKTTKKEGVGQWSVGGAPAKGRAVSLVSVSLFPSGAFKCCDGNALVAGLHKTRKCVVLAAPTQILGARRVLLLADSAV